MKVLVLWRVLEMCKAHAWGKGRPWVMIGRGLVGERGSIVSW
jgi:hypothetical protein